MKAVVEESYILCHFMLSSMYSIIHNCGLVLTVCMLDCDKNVKRHVVTFRPNVSLMNWPAQFHAFWNVLYAYEDHKH